MRSRISSLILLYGVSQPEDPVWKKASAEALAAAAVPPAPRNRRRRIPRPLLVGGGMLAVIVMAAALAPLISPVSPTTKDGTSATAFSPAHSYLRRGDGRIRARPFFSRTLHGAQLSLFMGVLATLVSLAIGVPLGLLAGYIARRPWTKRP